MVLVSQVKEPEGLAGLLQLVVQLEVVLPIVEYAANWTDDLAKTLPVCPYFVDKVVLPCTLLRSILTKSSAEVATHGLIHLSTPRDEGC